MLQGPAGLLQGLQHLKKSCYMFRKLIKLSAGPSRIGGHKATHRVVRA